MKEKYNVIFYDENDKEVGRKTYFNGYGGMIASARKRAIRIKAKYFWHIHFLRKFELEDSD